MCPITLTINSQKLGRSNEQTRWEFAINLLKLRPRPPPCCRGWRPLPSCDDPQWTRNHMTSWWPPINLLHVILLTRLQTQGLQKFITNQHHWLWYLVNNWNKTHESIGKFHRHGLSWYSKVETAISRQRTVRLPRIEKQTYRLYLKWYHQILPLPWPRRWTSKVKYGICYISAKDGLNATKCKVHI